MFIKVVIHMTSLDYWSSYDVVHEVIAKPVALSYVITLGIIKGFAALSLSFNCEVHSPRSVIIPISKGFWN